MRLVPVTTVTDAGMANVIQGLLEQAGIEAAISGTGTEDVYPTPLVNPLEILVAMANRLGAGWGFAGEASVFRAIAETEAPFAGMSYESIGMFGQEVTCPKS